MVHKSLYTINPQRACAARVTSVCQSVYLSVCLSVCQQLFSHYRLRGGPSAIPTSSELREPENKGDFPETTAFERYICRENKPICIIVSAYILRPIRLLFVPCGGTRSHHQGRLSTPASAFYLVASPCQTFRDQLAWRPRVYS